MDIVRSTIFIAVTGVQWMFSRKTFACASDGWGLGLGLAWRLVAQLAIVASLWHVPRAERARHLAPIIEGWGGSAPPMIATATCY